MQRNVAIVMILLMIQFILGMTVNLFGIPPDQQVQQPEPLFATISFFGHVFIGLLLLVFAIYILISAIRIKNNKWESYARYGLGSILIALIGGVLTIITKGIAEGITSFIMALGFLFSFISYGRFYYHLKQQLSSQ